MGLNVVVSVTIPAAQVRWARAGGYVLSRILRESIEKLQGGSDLSRIEQELAAHMEQVRILEAARDHTRARIAAEADSRERERGREQVIHRLARDFWSWRGQVLDPETRIRLMNGTRDMLPQSANVALVEGWIRKHRELRGMKSGEVLDLILSLKPSRSETE